MTQTNHLSRDDAAPAVDVAHLASRRRGTRLALIAAVALAVVGAVVAFAGLLPGLLGPSIRPIGEVSYAPSDAVASTPAATTASPADSPSAPPTPSRADIIAASPFQPVALAPMTRILIEGLDLRIDAAIQGLDAEVAVVDGVEVSVIDPPNAVDAFVWNARATRVGVAWDDVVDDASDFTVQLNADRAPEIFGHAGLGVGVFGELTGLAVGDRVTITTAAGELVYEVRGIHETPKGAAGAQDPTNPLIEGTGSPATIMLGSCIPDGPGGTSTTAAVYTAELVSSRPHVQ